MYIVSYIFWAMIAFILFRTIPGHRAFWITIIGGWIFLPPAHYAPLTDPIAFPYWIVGAGLPSDILVSKAWLAPGIGLAASLLFERKRWRTLEWGWRDLLIAFFCVWPIVQGLWVVHSDPGSVTSSAYLLAVWGFTWLSGKLYLRTCEDARSFAASLAMLTIILLPLAIIEGLSPIRIQALIYAPSPFALDGLQRYVGYRPQAFFEHGNQYGLWCAAATVAAAWRWQDEGKRPAWGTATLLLLFLTIASQSVGAIILLVLCLAGLCTAKAFHALRWGLPFFVAVALILGAAHLSGMVPLKRLATTTSVGKAIASGLNVTGRGSAAWRIGQDIKTIPLLRDQLVVGTGKWNWFAPAQSRPWGLPILIIGQFGLIGLAFVGVAFIISLQQQAVSAAGGGARARLYVLIILVFAADAVLNSFLFYPAIAVAAASRRRSPDTTTPCRSSSA